MIEIICRSICARCGETYERLSTVIQLPVGWTRLIETTKWDDSKADGELKPVSLIICPKCGQEFRDWLRYEGR